MGVPAPKIITCKQWGARPPKHTPVVTGRPDKIIEHHTNGHGNAAHLPPNSAFALACRYAQDLQHFHMETNGWSDSGHNFLVMRSGLILQGRWGTVSAIERGRMVVSAHCPGQNDQPGIEHEHLPNEVMTPEQWYATVELQSWICDRCGIRPTNLFPHNLFYNTACPSNLGRQLPELRLAVAHYITTCGRGKARRSLRFVTERSVRAEISAYEG